MTPWTILAGFWLALAPGPVSRTDVTEAKRLYTAGEGQLTAGHAELAVALWRRAIVLLPATAAYDAQRHALILRLGYGLLLANHQTGDQRHLEQAAELLTRYAERHEQLFGDDAEAKAQRGAIYEQLYEVERRLDPPADSPADDGPTAPAEPSAEVATTPGETIHRTVRVRKRRASAPSLDDARVFEWLAGPITNAETGLILTSPQLAPLTEARAYVRVAGRVRGPGRRSLSRQRSHQALATAVLEAVRPDLRACFVDAFSREPTNVVQTDAEFTVTRRGRVRGARIVGAPVIDARGSACVDRHLAAAQPENPRSHGRLRVPLVFFWKDANSLDEGNGVIVRDWMDSFRRPREVNHGAETELPSIDQWWH